MSLDIESSTMDPSEDDQDKNSIDTGSASRLKPPLPELASNLEISVPANGGSRLFKRWMDSIRWKKASIGALPERYVAGWPSEGSSDDAQLKKYNTFPRIRQGRRNKLSSASSSLLQTVKSASMSATSFSVISKTQKNTQCSTQRSACHSSGFSGSDVRMSIDSNVLTSTFTLDEAAWNRATKRRQLLREIHITEASYVTGLKALANVQPYCQIRTIKRW